MSDTPKRREVSGTTVGGAQFHVTPSRGWINDPCGLVCLDGVFHLYVQYHPDAPRWGPMHWLHFTSHDLARWEEQRVAFGPDERAGMAFTGSSVVVNGRIATIYTGAVPNPTPPGQLESSFQQQFMRMSSDGHTYSPPRLVLANPNHRRDERDPLVRPRDGGWVMALACGDHVEFYRSETLTQWEACGTFGPDPAGNGYGLGDAVWECPELLTLPVGEATVEVASSTAGAGSAAGDRATATVLVVHAGPGSAPTGAGAWYFVGSDEESGGLPTAPERAVSPEVAPLFTPVDLGHDFYAAQSWFMDESLDPGQQRSSRRVDVVAPKGSPVWIAWASHWAYAHELPISPDGTRGMLTVARSVWLADGALHQWPVPSLDTVLSDPLARDLIAERAPQTLDLIIHAPAATPVDVEIVFGDAPAAPGATTETGAPREHVTIALGTRSLSVDRRSVWPAAIGAPEAGFANRTVERTVAGAATGSAGAAPSGQSVRAPAGEQTAPGASSPTVVHRVVVDGTILEFFGDNGRLVWTDRIFPTGPITDVVVRAATDTQHEMWFAAER